jgi:hypothetical protein
MSTLIFDMQTAFFHCVTGKAPEVMESLGIKWEEAYPQPIFAAWKFVGCTNVPEVLPAYLRKLEGTPPAARPAIKVVDCHATGVCVQSGLRSEKSAVPLTVRLVSYPESNGKRNWTAMFARIQPWDGLIGNAGGVTIGRGEYWNRVAYEAERARFLIGERTTEPGIWAYGEDVKTPEEWHGADPESAFGTTKGQL